MKLETFFKKFDLLADAPGAVLRMRELVLDFAVAGSLLPRDGVWETRALKSLATKIGSGATPAGGRESYIEEGIPLIRSMNVHFRGFNPTGLVFLSDVQADQLSNVTVQTNDVLLNITGASIGRVTITPEKMSGARVNQHVTIIRTKPELYPRFLSIFLASPSIQRMIDEIQVGATRQALTKGMIELFQIPLPPLAEQKRIVAKVDELMALCDRLEAEQQERETRHAALARASLARFAEAPTAGNLHYLFHNSVPIPPADLRKAILTLAVQGKLVPQDSKDEPAETSRETDSLFDLPSNWRWRALGSLGLCRTGRTPPTNDPQNYGEGFPFIGPGQITPSGSFTAPDKTITSKGLESSTDAIASDILMVCIGGSIGKAAICRQPIGFNQQINSVRLNRALPEFVFSAMTAEYFQEQVRANASGSATPIINKGKWERIPVPLPPLAEQRRIVAKVEQLMASVDALETQLAAGRATAEKLLSALVAELTGTKSTGKASKPAASGTGRRGRPRKL